jgi:hypothetical protein
MIIVFDLDASRRDIDHVVRRAASLRLKTHVSQQGGRTRVGLHGDLNGLDHSVFSGLPGVQDVRTSRDPSIWPAGSSRTRRRTSTWATRSSEATRSSSWPAPVRWRPGTR